MGYQQEHNVLGRLFQHFEQAVGGLEVHALRRMYQHHAQPAAHRGEVDAVHDAAYRVDFDLQQFAADCFALGYFGREFVKIGMAFLGEQMAGHACAAGFVVILRRLAQQRLRRKARELSFTGVFPAGKQPRVGPVLPVFGDLPPLLLVPRINHVGRGRKQRKPLLYIGYAQRGRLKNRGLATEFSDGLAFGSDAIWKSQDNL